MFVLFSEFLATDGQGRHERQTKKRFLSGNLPENTPHHLRPTGTYQTGHLRPQRNPPPAFPVRGQYNSLFLARRSPSYAEKRMPWQATCRPPLCVLCAPRASNPVLSSLSQSSQCHAEPNHFLKPSTSRKYISSPISMLRPWSLYLAVVGL